MIDDVRHPHVRGMGMASARSRTRLVARLRERGIADERVLAALERVPRHLFVDEAMSSRAYDDTALPIGYGQTISQPYVVAIMTGLLLRDGVPANVLEIGTGSGYQAAVLAELIDAVYTVERVQPLYEQVRRRLSDLGYKNVRARLARPDALGLAGHAPFEAILMTAGAETVPDALLQQLAVGGRLVAPIGVSGQQRLVLLQRQGSQSSRETLDAVSFVPLIEN